MLISKRLGDNIKKIRTRKGMSQGDICRALDMDRGYMSAIENGKKNITIQQLERLAQALGISVDKLLK
ncbi:MAG: helix-turn-helix transcriptional regulator [bacterium]|nr:helix-turn-helix transcriptional regulator [bacterium]